MRARNNRNRLRPIARTFGGLTRDYWPVPRLDKYEAARVGRAKEALDPDLIDAKEAEELTGLPKDA